MQKKGEWDAVLGIRRDVDLTERWWHRLFKVVYILALSLAILISTLLIWEASDDLPARTGQIKIVTDLGEELQDADMSVPNVVPIFLKQPGKIGYLPDDSSKDIEEIFEYNLNNSICTAAPLRHVGEIASVLNRRTYREAYTIDMMTETIIKQGVTLDKPLRLCWLDTSLQGKHITNIIKYDFTWRGYINALWRYSFPFIAWIGSLHILFLNLYYRGLVYIIVGPRKEIQSKPAVDEDDDDDWKEIDDEIDKLTKGSA